MTESAEGQQFRQVAQKFDPESKVLRAWSLEGGISARVTALEIRQADGQTKKIVVRQHGGSDLKQNPHVAEDEFKLLQILQCAHIAAPSPYLFDDSGEVFSTPYIVVEYIEGDTEFALHNLDDFLLQLATHLVKIHSVDCSVFDLSFLPEQERKYTGKLKRQPTNVDESLAIGPIRDTLAQVRPLPPRNKRALLHGDFWPGNILWENGRLVGIIDWEDAQLGDPLADLANGRLEILWAFGMEAMHNFTCYYKETATLDFTDLPYYDLFAALRHALNSAEWPTYSYNEKTIREGYRLFITQAFEKLAI